MGIYCTVQDVWEKIKIDDGVMSDDEVEKRITEAEKWVNGYQATSYTAPIADLIKYATAAYAASLVLDFLFTASEPNESNQSKRLVQKAKEYLDAYSESQDEAQENSDIAKINSDFFEDDTG